MPTAAAMHIEFINEEEANSRIALAVGDMQSVMAVVAVVIGYIRFIMELTKARELLARLATIEFSAIAVAIEFHILLAVTTAGVTEEKGL